MQGTGSDEEMGIEERQQLALEGIVVAAVDVVRSGVTGVPAQDPLPSSSEAPPAQRPSQMRAQIRVTTRAMWVDNGRLLEVLHKVGQRFEQQTFCALQFKAFLVVLLSSVV